MKKKLKCVFAALLVCTSLAFTTDLHITPKNEVASIIPTTDPELPDEH